MKESVERNPWLGLEAYKEGEILYGRDDDIRDLAQCVLNDTETLLYGKSGIGKSSILNAGVLPLARRNGYIPVLIRLSHKEGKNYLEQIAQSIVSAVISSNADVVDKPLIINTGANVDEEDFFSKIIKEVVPLNNSTNESFYEFFHRHTFHNIYGERIKLLIIFDQFEEIFTLQEDVQVKKAFFADLADLLNDIMPNELQCKVDVAPEKQENIEFVKDEDFEDIFEELNMEFEDGSLEYVKDNDIHFVFTIREDFLSEFEYYSSAIPPLKQNRYGLRPINEEQASQIILRPIPGLIDRAVAELIIKKITEKKDFRLDGIPEVEVDSAVLSLYLNRLYDAKEDGNITKELVERKGGAIISDFYNDALFGISESTIEYLEDMLLNGQGRRDNITVYDAVNEGQISEDELDILCNKKKILRQFNYAGDLRIEYIHDILCPVVREHKESRMLLKKQKEQQQKLLLEEERRRKEIEQEKNRLKEEALYIRTKNRKRIIYLASLLMFAAIITFVLVHSNNDLKISNQKLDELNKELISQQNRILRSQQKLLSVKIKQLLDAGDSYTARRLCLNVLSKGQNQIVNSSSSFTNILRCMSNNNNAILRGHESAVLDVAYNPEKPLIASVSDTTVIVWNSSNGMRIRTLNGHRENILSVTFSPDGSKLATASEDKTIRVYDVSEWKECYPPLSKHQKGVRFIMFSPDGKRIVSASKDKSICVWNAENGSLQKMYSNVHDDEVLYLSLSEDRCRMASASADKSIKIWDIKKDSLLCTLTGHTDWVRSVDFSPINNEQLVSVSDDGTIRVWNLDTKEDTILHKTNCYVTRALYTIKGNEIVASYRDGTVRVWDVGTRTESVQMQGIHKSYVNALAVSPDGRSIASAGSDMLVRLWDFNSNLRQSDYLAHDSKILHIATDGKSLISVGDDCKVACWDLDKMGEGPIWEKTTKDKKFQRAVINPQKNRVALVGYGSILIRDMETGELLKSKNEAHRGWVYAVDVSPDGEYLVSAGADRSICVWDWDLNEQKRYQKCHLGIITSVKYSHDGTQVVSSSGDKTIKVWNVSNDSISLVKELKGHSDDVLYATFSKDDKSILSCSGDKTARIWTIETEQHVTFYGHGGFVNYALYGTDENEIVTVSSDKIIRIWDVKTQRELLALHGHKGCVTSVVIDENKSNLITSSWDNTIRVWEYPLLGDVIGDIYDRFGENPLTDDELMELDVM